MESGMDDILRYLDENERAAEEDLKALLRIPSVSADPQYHPDCRRAADWVAAQFREMGLATEVIPTVGQPLVYAESPPVPGKPVALVYGHYDVQPPDPLAEWITPPFEPTVRNGNIYARGATDDKGQMLTHVQSAKAWLKTRGQLPMQVKFLIEGEEESGGAGINEFFARPTTPDKLRCDCVVVSDTCQFAPGQPAITYGLRGIAYFELRLTGPKQDLHSGTFGGAVTNPLNALCGMLAALRDSQGRVQVPGFYNDVLPLTEKERQQFAALPLPTKRFKNSSTSKACSAKPAIRHSNAAGLVPPTICTASGGAIKGKGAKRCCLPRRPPNSASALCRIRIHTRSPSRSKRF
jgi:succinyl-diaminopimelate desuccinylase